MHRLASLSPKFQECFWQNSLENKYLETTANSYIKSHFFINSVYIFPCFMHVFATEGVKFKLSIIFQKP